VRLWIRFISSKGPAGPHHALDSDAQAGIFLTSAWASYPEALLCAGHETSPRTATATPEFADQQDCPVIENPLGRSHIDHMTLRHPRLCADHCSTFWSFTGGDIP